MKISYEFLLTYESGEKKNFAKTMMIWSGSKLIMLILSTLKQG